MATLVLGTLLGGTALAVTSGSEKRADDVGEMGASPIPVAAKVSGPTSFRVSSFNILGYDHTAPGGSKKGYADGAMRMKWAAQLIKSRQVDVVGLQEFQPQQYDKWVKKASAQYDIFPGYIDTIGFLRNSIAWRKDKFRLVSTIVDQAALLQGRGAADAGGAAPVGPDRPADLLHELPEPRRRPRQRREVAAASASGSRSSWSTCSRRATASRSCGPAT